MTEDSAYSPSGDVLSPDTNLNITIGGPQSSDPLLDVDGNELDIDSNDIDDDDGEELLGMNDGGHLLELNDEQGLEIIENDQNGVSDEKDYYPPPVTGMEFDSYDDAYNYYNCYAKELGFAIRVKSSWTKRKSKEKRGAVLCCNCEGFKMITETRAQRKETRTGCLAMLRLRLVESNRWRLDEVKLEHNHSFDHVRANNSKSRKKMDGAKRKVEPNLDVEVQTIKLYRTAVPNAENLETRPGWTTQLKLSKGDAEIMQTYFCRAQLTDPNFIYLMDFNDEGHLRNVFWIDSRSRAAYSHFGDVVSFDSTCLSRNYKIPLFAFVGINHHGESILLGCGLVADETLETYIWLFRAWLTCMSGRPPQTIVTDQGKTMQNAVSEVFPRAHHRFSLPHLMQNLLGNLGGELSESRAFLEHLNRIVYDSHRAELFETAWDDMTQRLGVEDRELFRSLYETRERWAPVYLKDTFLAGISGFRRGDTVSSFFDNYVHQRTSLREFFDTHEATVEEKRRKENLDDMESREQSPGLKTRCFYELQLSKIYTKAIFGKFQEEVVMMSNCVSISQIQSNGTITTYIIKEHEAEGDFEVMYDKSRPDVRCLCGCFNFNGFLCRHALCVLNCNGAEEIPFHYILARWRKDFKRLYVADFGSNSIDMANPVQWFDHLYRRAMHVVQEGVTSRDHYSVAWQAFKESLNKVRLSDEKHV